MGYSFRRRDLLKSALEHSTYVNEHPTPGVERLSRLAFLGDAVVELVVRRSLLAERQDDPVGALSIEADRRVRTRDLAARARAIGLGELIALGKGGEAQGIRSNDRVLADAFEAILGAVYVDADNIQTALDVATRLGVADPAPF